MLNFNLQGVTPTQAGPSNAVFQFPGDRDVRVSFRVDGESGEAAFAERRSRKPTRHVLRRPARRSS